MKPYSIQPREHLIQSPAAVRALLSPIRQEIIDALESSQACSMAELAQLLGRQPDALYFHVRRLLKVGLLIEREPRKTGRHVAAVYDLPGRPMRLDHNQAANQRVLAKVVAAALRLASRDTTRSLLRGEPAMGLARTAWAGRCKGWLSPTDIARVNRHIEQIQSIVKGSRARGRSNARDRRLISVGISIAALDVPARPEFNQATSVPHTRSTRRSS